MIRCIHCGRAGSREFQPVRHDGHLVPGVFECSSRSACALRAARQRRQQRLAVQDPEVQAALRSWERP